VEVEVHLVQGKIHLNGILKLELECAVWMRDLNVARLDGEIELAGASENGGTHGFIRSSGGVRGERERASVLAKVIVLVIDRRQGQKDAHHSGQNENGGDQTPERELLVFLSRLFEH
jgi:hypothetical protein